MASYLRRWHRPDDRAHNSFCGHCNKSLGHRSSDTCFLEDWNEKNMHICVIIVNIREKVSKILFI